MKPDAHWARLHAASAAPRYIGSVLALGVERVIWPGVAAWPSKTLNATVRDGARSCPYDSMLVLFNAPHVWRPRRLEQTLSRGHVYSFPSCTRLRRSRCYQLRWSELGVANPKLIPNAWSSLYLASHHLSARRTRALSFVFVVAASRPLPQSSCLTYQIQALARLLACLPAQLWRPAADHATDPPALCEHRTKEARVWLDSAGVASNPAQDSPVRMIIPASILASMAKKD